VAEEARRCLRAEISAVLATGPDEAPRIVASSPPAADTPRPGDLERRLRPLLDGLDLPATLAADDATALAAALGHDVEAACALLLPMGSADRPSDTALLLISSDRRLAEAELPAAFAELAGTCLEQRRRLAEQHAGAGLQQRLVAAARALAEPRELPQLLETVCEQAALALGGDVAVLYRGDADGGLAIAAAHGLGPEALGARLGPGLGVAGRALALARPALAMPGGGETAGPLAAGVLLQLGSAVAVPVSWDGVLRGALLVGHRSLRPVSDEEVRALEALAALAGCACRNASIHAALVQAASTDGLTGCLNHSAFQERLRGEIERCARTDGRLALVLLDLDDFKAINETHGHLVGDEILRRVGHVLRVAVRPYDIVARYGGDEFAVLAIDSDEAEAEEIARRALDRLAETLEASEHGHEIGGSGRATAGVAEWDDSLTPVELLERADRALLYGKGEALAAVVAASTVPEGFQPGRFRRPWRPRLRTRSALRPVSPEWPVTPEGEDQRLRSRLRLLALSAELGTRIRTFTDVAAIAGLACDELVDAFGFESAAVLRRHPGGTVETVVWRGSERLPHSTRDERDAGRAQALERALVERRATAVPTGEHAPRELLLPLLLGDEPWGAIAVAAATAGGAGDLSEPADVHVLEGLATEIGTAIATALAYGRLEAAYDDTVAALAGALEARRPQETEAGRRLAGLATAVGRRLGMSAAELRDLHYAAIVHDIGTVAVPDAILNKRGPLDSEERAIVERHPVVAEEILAPVPYLAGARILVRHEHERWDGGGYPDGLQGEQIELGARVLLACDAYDSMTSDRPYRRALEPAAAIEELRRAAGTQLDSRVVDALIQMLEQDLGLAPPLFHRPGPQGRDAPPLAP
jgi:diguanylate cyclase (GGDEF)-like protein